MENKSINNNELLVEFDFIIDLDLAIFKMIKDKYADSEYVDKKIISMNNEYKIIDMLLHRDHINPLEVIMPNVDTTILYNQLINSEDLLNYAPPYDTLYLMITFLKNASSLGITIWCRNQAEYDRLRSITNAFNVLILPERSMIDITKYTAIFMKDFSKAIEYKNLSGKYIYILAAKYNFEDGKNTIIALPSLLFGDVNIIKLMDPYTAVKYRFDNEGDNEDEDLFEHRTGEESTRDSEGNAWYNFGLSK